MHDILTLKKKFGVPRALSYYSNFPFDYGVLSDKTTSRHINDGASNVVSDVCLLIKIFVGYLNNLLDKGMDTVQSLNLIEELSEISYWVNKRNMLMIHITIEEHIDESLYQHE